MPNRPHYKCVDGVFPSNYSRQHFFNTYIHTSYATLSSGIIYESLLFSRYTHNQAFTSGIFHRIPQKSVECVTILYHAIENTLTNFRRE